MNVGVKVREISTGSIGVIEKGNNQNGFFVNFGSRKNWKRNNEVEVIQNTIDNSNGKQSATPKPIAQQQQQQQQPPQQSQQQQQPSQPLKPIPATRPVPTIPKVQSEDPGPRFGNFTLPTTNSSTKYSTLPSRQFFEVSSSPGDENGTFKRSAAPPPSSSNQNGSDLNKVQSPSRPSIPSFEPPTQQPTQPLQKSPRNVPIVPKRTNPSPPSPPLQSPQPTPQQQPPPLKPIPQPQQQQQQQQQPPPLKPIPQPQQSQPNQPIKSQIQIPITNTNGNTNGHSSLVEKSPRNNESTTATTKDMWNIDYKELKFVGNEIGSGKYGSVSLGYWLGTPVAIKKLHENNEETEILVQRELQILKEIRHPQIVQFLGVSRNEKDEIHIITEFMDGGDLFDALIFGDIPLTWKEKLRISLDIAQSCRFLHARGILHRDLKSQNILLSTNRRAKLCDLGLARMFEERINKRYTCVGTEIWMAPEVCLDQSYSTAVDVFSFGIVLVEIITEKIPDERFPQHRFQFDAPAFLKKVPKECPPDFSKLCVDCTKYNPKERPSFIKVLDTIQNIYDSLPDDDEENYDQ
ncbi:hypothetical protein ACTFIY_007588 [Dictyostelium cf. discoideum]